MRARCLAFADATALKQAEKDGRIKVHLWPVGRGAQLALYPNLNAVAPGWPAAPRDVRFRRALSLGIHRADLNHVLYQVPALPGAAALLPGPPPQAQAHRQPWSGSPPKHPTELLAQLGTRRKDAGGHPPP